MSVNEIDLTHVNIRSLNDDKMDAIRAELLLDNDIICITETNLPLASVHDLNLNGFNPIVRKDRIGRTGGGVALYVADHLGCTRMIDFELPDLEALWVKIKAGNNSLLLCVCYRPPNAKADFWLRLQDTIDLAKKSGLDCIMLVKCRPQHQRGSLSESLHPI